MLNDNIISVEHTNNTKELAFYYANAEVFYNPTLEDNFPTVNIESLACGTPVVLFKDCSGGEEIINSTNGIVLDKNTMELNIYDKIKSLANLDKMIMSKNIQKLCGIGGFCQEYKEKF